MPVEMGVMSACTMDLQVCINCFHWIFVHCLDCFCAFTHAKLAFEFVKGFHHADQITLPDHFKSCHFSCSWISFVKVFGTVCSKRGGFCSFVCQFLDVIEMFSKSVFEWLLGVSNVFFVTWQACCFVHCCSPLASPLTVAQFGLQTLASHLAVAWSVDAVQVKLVFHSVFMWGQLGIFHEGWRSKCTTFALTAMTIHVSFSVPWLSWVLASSNFLSTQCKKMLFFGLCVSFFFHFSFPFSPHCLLHLGLFTVLGRLSVQVMQF